MQTTALEARHTFSKYQIFVIAILAFIQFTVILDFMVLAPLSAILLPALHITPSQFSIVVSSYAFSAGISGLFAAGFADRYDRKKMLMFFYAGFVLGTFLCGIAPTYFFLLGARIVTGMFGGVIASVCFAIVTDLFEMEKRGRVMGFLQMGFAGSQVLGLPIGLYLATHFGWHAPFLMIVAISVVVGVIVLVYLQPISDHLKVKSDKNALQHLFKTVSNSGYLKAFAATTLLATGGFMLMPFGSVFAVHNLGLTMEQLPMLYLVTGVFSMVAGPLAGRFSDKIGKFSMFLIGSIITLIMVTIYCNLGTTPIWLVLLINIILFAGILSRIIPASALMTAIPETKDRGAFMSVNSSVQQISGGIAAALAGLIVVQSPAGMLERYDTLGYVVAGSIVISVLMMYNINNYVKQKMKVVK